MLTRRFRDTRLPARLSKAILKDQSRKGMATTDSSQYSFARQKISVIRAECTKRVKRMAAKVVTKGI